ncbi:hypothetical protein DENSPDRAFT_584428 [Dentipellis sp. KUC8613]|nr:hypothetical protein DENSPDRAFT_584428 [Dentipellis sp. KUC8613]
MRAYSPPGPCPRASDCPGVGRPTSSGFAIARRCDGVYAHAYARARARTTSLFFPLPPPTADPGISCGLGACTGICTVSSAHCWLTVWMSPSETSLAKQAYRLSNAGCWVPPSSDPSRPRCLALARISDLPLIPSVQRERRDHAEREKEHDPRPAPSRSVA